MAETYYAMTDIVKLIDNLIAAMPTSFYNGIMAVRGGLATAPAADVVPVRHGRWIVSRTDYGWNSAEFPTHSKCSLCGREIPYQDRDNFCPNCGARMDMVTDCNQVKDGDGE